MKYKKVLFDPNTLSKEAIHKKKSLIKKLANQLCFYFSNQNLAFDNFLVDKIKNHKHGFVKIRIFMKCGKIKELFSLYRPELSFEEKIKMLRGACKEDNFLQLNRLQNMIKRRDLKVENL